MTEESVHVTLARIEGKLDLQSAGIEHLVQDGADYEARLRVLESRVYISPKLFWLGCSAAAALATVMPVFLNISGS